jgi:uncharacterized membrane protein
MPPELQPILAAVLSVVALILLVTRFRVHPFLGLLVASLMLGFLAGLVPADIIKNFGKGFGDDAEGVRGLSPGWRLCGTLGICNKMCSALKERNNRSNTLFQGRPLGTTKTHSAVRGR